MNLQFQKNKTLIKNSNIMKKVLLIIFGALLFFTCKDGAPTKNSEVDASQIKKANDKWVVLFDGSSTDAFRGYGIDEFPEGVWNVENGVLMTNSDTANRDLITKARYKDFEMEYEWAVDTAANSGVFFHMQEDLTMEAGNGNSPNWLDNFEIQVLDDIHFPDTAAVRSAGSVYDLIIPKNKTLKPIGDFNEAKLLHKEGHVEHWLNGSKVVEFEMGSQEMKALLAGSKFNVNPDFHSHKEGHIMFQHHGQKVYYRNIRIKEL